MQGPAISQATVTTAEPRRAPTPGSPPPYVPKVPHTPLPACTHALTRHAIANLTQCDLADLSDVARLLALHQHAIARGWLQGGEAAQLNVVAAAVHARRVGEAPCRLFVALLGLAAAAVRKPTVAQYTLSFKYLQSANLPRNLDLPGSLHVTM